MFLHNEAVIKETEDNEGIEYTEEIAEALIQLHNRFYDLLEFFEQAKRERLLELRVKVLDKLIDESQQEKERLGIMFNDLKTRKINLLPINSIFQVNTKNESFYKLSMHHGKERPNTFFNHTFLNKDYIERRSFRVRKAYAVLEIDQEQEQDQEEEMLAGCQASLLDFLIQLPQKPDMICFEKMSIHTTNMDDIIKAFLTLRGSMWVESAVMIAFRVLSILFLLEVKRCEDKEGLSKVMFTHPCTNGEVHNLCAKDFYFCGYTEIKSRLGNRYEDVLVLDMKALQECLNGLLRDLQNIFPNIDSVYKNCCQMMKCETCAAKIHALVLVDQESKELPMRKET